MTIVDALDAAGVRYRRGGRPDEIYVCCPFCSENGESPDTRFRLGINVRTAWSHCFNCKWRTRDKDWLAKELVRALRMGLFEMTVGKYRPSNIKVKLPEDFELLGKSNDFWARKAYKYIRKRRVTDEQIRKHKIGFSLVDRDMKYRVVIPIYYEGKLKGLVGRDFTGEREPPYKNSMGEKVLPFCPKKPKKGTFLLLEGVFDALAVERATKKVDPMPVLGHSLTELQLKQLKPYKKGILWPDPDGPGVSGFIKIADQLSSVRKKVYMIVPEGDDERDPDELSVKERREKIAGAKPYTPELSQRLRAWLAFKEEDE